MSHEAFLRTIIAQPDDDLPRLVYADWLDENDDPARAEFIRVQCELAHLPDDAERRPMLEDREHELLSEHEPAWLGSDLIGLQEWEFQRGFLHSVTARLDDLMSYPDSFHQLTTVRDYTPTERVGGTVPKDLLRSPLFARLESFDLSQFGHFDQTLDGLLTKDRFPALKRFSTPRILRNDRLGSRLKNWPVISQLQSLILSGSETRDWQNPFDTQELVSGLATSQLSELLAHDCDISVDGLCRLLAAPFAANLKSLDISRCPVDEEGLRAFRDANPAMRLRRLDVSITLLAEFCLPALLNSRCLKEMTELEINQCDRAVFGHGMEILSNSRYWSQAKEFRASHGYITATNLEPLCRVQGSPNLKILDLVHNSLGTEGIRLLCEAPWASGLTWLGLTENHLDDNSIQLIAESGRFLKLRTLHLGDNWNFDANHEHHAITDASAFAIANSTQFANLRILTVGSNSITERGVEALMYSPHSNLSGLGLQRCELTKQATDLFATSPRLKRMTWLDLSANDLPDNALLPLAESPYLSRLCELDIRGCGASDRVREILRERLGPRLSD